MIKNAQNQPLETSISSPLSIRNHWIERSDDSDFSHQISQALATAQARALSEELTALEAEPSHIWERALNRAWDCWCNLTGMSAWNQDGILKHQLSSRALHRLKLQCRLDRLDARTGFPQLELSWSESEAAAVRFVLPTGQNLEQARTWHEEFAMLDSVEQWPEMLWRLSRRELRKARAEIDGIQQKCREKKAELDQCIQAWTIATWNLLTSGTWASLQGDELNAGASPSEAMGTLVGGERAPFWEWKERAQTSIILAIRLIQPSSSGKRWQIAGRKVSDDLFSSPQGQTAFTAWKRTADIKNQLRLHLISQLR